MTRAQFVHEISYKSTADNSMQPAMFYHPDAAGSIPLIIALHTWSGDFRQNDHSDIAKWCADNGWAYIHPDFRGPNRRPEATGSDLVIADIASAVEYAVEAADVDPNAVYLVGTSGGGYAALLMAGRRPELWAGVSAWVPISDLSAWYAHCRTHGLIYQHDIAVSCGGAPGDSREIDAAYRARSPLTWLENAKGVRLHINAGIVDGHTGSVPVSQSLNAFNAVANEVDRISSEDIHYMTERADVPTRLRTSVIDPAYEQKKPLFRRSSGMATITIFDGGHELIHAAAIDWIVSIHQKR